jgi:hypothetical protein
MTQTQVNQLPAFPSDMPLNWLQGFTLDLSVLNTQLSMAPMDSARFYRVIVSFPNLMAVKIVTKL